MPELPEVETIIRGLRNKILDKKITKIEVNYSKSIQTHSASEFQSIILNHTITDISRRGKYIIFHLSMEYFLILHLRMTGKVIVANEHTKATKHDHVIFHLENNIRVLYNDTRKFGRFYLTKNLNQIIGKLGPEPLDDNFIFSEFSKKLMQTQRKIKALLLDQHFVAGLGNIYTDEALWEAKINPEKQANLISKQKQKALFQAIQNVLLKGIENHGTSLGDGKTNYVASDNISGKNQHSLNVFARTDKPCPNCSTSIKKIVVAQRGTHFCPKCQKI